nr:cell adhesion molecule 2-like [Lepeophtheirus salmonis]
MLGVDGPSWINLGDTVTLTCRYDLGRDAIYSMKWYKDSKELYKYIPTYKPEYITFKQPGIIIDEESTRPNQLVFKVESPLGSGQYSCEITIETPSFRTYNKTSNLTVIVPPKFPPKIKGINSSYRSGDLVEINCTSSDSKPAAKLTWFMNGEPIQSNYALPLIKEFDSETGLETSRLDEQFGYWFNTYMY